MRQHVIPLDDLKEHECSIHCPCKPRVTAKVAVHNSWDGREITERASKELDGRRN